jgi:hypothetical protein
MQIANGTSYANWLCQKTDDDHVARQNNEVTDSQKLINISRPSPE